MKKTALLTTLMLLLIACSGSKSKGNAKDQPQRSDYTFKVTFNDIGGGWSNGLTVQGYYQGEETDFSFEPDELAGQYDEDARENIEWIREPDIDFDGEPDLLIYIGMPPYEMFHAFRWLPEEAIFEHVDNFTDILNPVVDKQAKAIRSQYRNNSGDSLITEVWKWKQGKLQCVDRKSQSYSESLPDRSARTFKTSFEFDEDDQWITEIHVQEYANGEPTDFDCTYDIGGSFDHPQAENFPWLSYPDVNFDGQPDLLIYVGLGGSGSASSLYEAYIWNPQSRQWDYCEEFEHFIEPEIDEDAKTIYTSYRNGPDDFVQEEWKWVDGKLTMTKQKVEKIN